MTISQEFLGTFEASEYLGCSLRHLYRLIAEGRLRAYKPAGKLRVRREDLEAFIESALVVPGGRDGT